MAEQHESGDVLATLDGILQQRRSADPGSSYVASLYDRGLDAILKKVGEESVETIIAAKGNDRDALVYETADLWFHTLVMLAAQDLSSADVLAELERRFGLSGLDEKASRDS